MTPAADVDSVELDELVVTAIVDNATDTLSSIPPGVPQVPEMVPLLAGPAIGTYAGHRMARVL